MYGGVSSTILYVDIWRGLGLTAEDGVFTFAAPAAEVRPEEPPIFAPRWCKPESMQVFNIRVQHMCHYPCHSATMALAHP